MNRFAILAFAAFSLTASAFAGPVSGNTGSNPPPHNEQGDITLRGFFIPLPLYRLPWFWIIIQGQIGATPRFVESQPEGGGSIDLPPG